MRGFGLANNVWVCCCAARKKKTVGARGRVNLQAGLDHARTRKFQRAEAYVLTKEEGGPAHAVVFSG